MITNVFLVFFDNEDPGPKGIYVKRGNIVGIVEERHDGFLKVRPGKLEY